MYEYGIVDDDEDDSNANNSIVEGVIEKQLRRLREQESVIKNALLLKTRHNVLNNITQSLDFNTLTNAERQINSVYDLTSSVHATRVDDDFYRRNRESSSFYRPLSSASQYLANYDYDAFKYELIPTKLKKQYEALDSQMRHCSICTNAVLGYEYNPARKSTESKMSHQHGAHVVDLNNEMSKSSSSTLRETKNTLTPTATNRSTNQLHVSFSDEANYTNAELDALKRPLSSENDYAWTVRNRHFYQNPPIIRSRSQIIAPQKPTLKKTKQNNPSNNNSFMSKSVNGFTNTREPWHYGKGAGNKYSYRDYTLKKLKF